MSDELDPRVIRPTAEQQFEDVYRRLTELTADKNALHERLNAVEGNVARLMEKDWSVPNPADPPKGGSV